MTNYICVICGNQFGESAEPPPRCPICEDERQWVNYDGQSWTTLDEMAGKYRNVMRPLEPGLTEFSTAPKFGIGQRTLLVQTDKGNVLWDCVSHLDQETVDVIESLGGIAALCMSHPHMFGSMVDWSLAFGRAPIYLPASFERWVQRPDAVIEYWDGDSFELDQGLTVYRCGGHYQGSSALHWPDGANGKGVLLSSDTMYVTADRKYVGFMYSYPNYIPLSLAAVEKIADTLMPLKFDRLYSHFTNRQILEGGKEAVRRSVNRYRAIFGD